MIQLQALLTSSKPIIGPFMKATDPAFVETAGLSGFDFVILDMEHGPASLKDIEHNIRAARIGNTSSIIRVKNTESISSVLDLGADGFMLPDVTSVTDAKDAIAKAKFFPLGARGVCRYVRAAGYSSLEKQEYFQYANQRLCIIQIEGEEAIAELPQILELEGLDMIFIGPYDLSQSLGIPGDVQHPKVVDKMKDIVRKARESNVKIGTFVDDMEMAFMWKNTAVQFIAYSVDVGIFAKACSDIVQKFKSNT